MIIESGPGRVLSGLIKRINRDIDVLSLNTLDSFQSIINGASHDN
jgi:malonyl CoA-acyl carrier protein transacylase